MMVYISHPYTGNETKNRREAELIAVMLSEKLPRVTFVNPLNAFRHLKKAKVGYENALGQCIEILDKCDGIIMSGKWKDSYGCNQEYEHAKAAKMTIWESVEDFRADEIMPDDRCENHPCCWECYCRVCAERLSCWNCNDCTIEKGKKRGVGFTGKTKGNVSCARFRRKEDTR